MNSLSHEDLEINRSGSLTKEQLRFIKGKGVVNAIAGVCFLALIPAALFSANVKLSGLVYVLFGIGALIALAFIWIAWGYLFIKPDGHEIINITGKVTLKPSGNKNILLKVGDRSFFVRKSEVQSMKDGDEYTIYFIENPKMPLGYTRN